MKLSPSRVEVKNALSFTSTRPLMLGHTVWQIFLLTKKYAWVWLPTRRTLSVESFLLITLHVSGPLTHHQESAVDVIQNFLHPYGYVCCSVCCKHKLNSVTVIVQ
jgi:hypothetical protein